MNKEKIKKRLSTLRGELEFWETGEDEYGGSTDTTGVGKYLTHVKGSLKVMEEIELLEKLLEFCD